MSIRGHRTSFSLEDAFFAEIERLAASRELTVAALVAEVDEARDRSVNLSSALRLHVISALKAEAVER